MRHDRIGVEYLMTIGPGIGGLINGIHARIAI